MSRQLVIFSLTSILVVLAIVSTLSFDNAWATFPGYNGNIVFQGAQGSDYDIAVVNHEGMQLQWFTDNDAFSGFPPTWAFDGWARWSPDGKKIVFESDREGGNRDIYVMNADGSNVIRLTEDTGSDRFPTWSPDGEFIIFQRVISIPYPPTVPIFIMNSDGTNEQPLTGHISGFGADPDWTETNDKIVFVSAKDRSQGAEEIYVMNADGTGETRLTFSTDSGGDSSGPSWHPDGTKIVFHMRDGDSGADYQIYVMNADGSNIEQLTIDDDHKVFPKWSPDGEFIIFQKGVIGTNTISPERASSIYIMNADGTDQRVFIDQSGFDVIPDWQPRDCPPGQLLSGDMCLGVSIAVCIPQHPETYEIIVLPNGKIIFVKTNGCATNIPLAPELAIPEIILPPERIFCLDGGDINKCKPEPICGFGIQCPDIDVAIPQLSANAQRIAESWVIGEIPDEQFLARIPVLLATGEIQNPFTVNGGGNPTPLFEILPSFVVLGIVVGIAIYSAYRWR